MQTGMANVSGGAEGNLWGQQGRGRRRGAILLDKRGGGGQLSAQHEVDVLCGLGPRKCGVDSGGAGALGGRPKKENWSLINISEPTRPY